MNLLSSLGLVVSEEVLSVVGLILLLVSAWGGDKAARSISLAAVAVLAAVAFAVPALSLGNFGPSFSAFNGQFAQDSFASYAKILIYLGAAITLVVAPRFLKRR
jgi:NADH-quinone oxidoreductase subunit N